MALLDQLFGQQFGQQNQNQDAGGLVQNILSQRFQPSTQDAASAMGQTLLGGQLVNPSQVMMQRVAPALGVASTMGQLNMSQLAMQRLEEEQMRDRMMWIMQFGKLPGGGGMMGDIMRPPAMDNSGYSPPVGFPPQSNIPKSTQTTTDINQLYNQLYPQEKSSGGEMASPQGGEVPLIQNQTNQSNNSQPITTGFGMPATIEGLPGQQWARTPEGKIVATQIAGAPPKMEGGVAVTTDPNTGQPIQQVPANPMAKAKFEDALQRLAIKINELRQEGGTVEQGGNIGSNIVNTIAASNASLPVPGTEGERIELPGGQTIARAMGSKAQGTRDEIQSIVQQEMLPYMQAVGATPGMERAFGAQMAMLKSLGGNTYMQRDTMLNNLASLSAQAGTGEFAKMRSPEIYNPISRQQQLQQAINPAQSNTDTLPAQKEYNSSNKRIPIITPDGKTGTIDAQHLQDLFNAGGKLAQ